MTRPLRWWAAVRARRVVIAAMAAVAVIAAFVHVSTKGPQTHTFTADLAASPGLYPGNQVDILGITVGRVLRVAPNPEGARVTFEVPASVRVPAGVQVLLMAPALISDRFIQLTPPYTGGPQLQDHGVIPRQRTAVPVSVDQIFNSIDQLANALGPNGANAKGALSQLVHNAATSFGPNGNPLHRTILSLGQALGALSNRGTDLSSLLDSVGSLTTAAKSNLTEYQTFTADLAMVSSYLASDNSDTAAALSDLQAALAQLTTFVTDDGAALGGSFANLKTFAATVASDEANLAKTFAVLPVALQNIAAAYNPNAPGGPGLTARLDPVGGSGAFSTSVCGNALLRLLTVALATPAAPDLKSADDLICGLNGVAAKLPVPPGASAGPNLSVSALVGGQP